VALEARIRWILNRLPASRYRELDPGRWRYRYGRRADQSFLILLDMTGQGKHFCGCIDPSGVLNQRTAPAMLCDHILAAMWLGGYQGLLLGVLTGTSQL